MNNLCSLREGRNPDLQGMSRSARVKINLSGSRGFQNEGLCCVSMQGRVYFTLFYSTVCT